MQSTKFRNVDDYIRRYPKPTQLLMQEIRKTILETVPDAEEGIGYNMPAYKYYGVLCYFAGYDNHIGFYPTNSPISFFEDELTKYKTSKGTVQFPLDKPIPKSLVKKLVKFKMKENLEKKDLKRTAARKAE
jgi:uncharacterized protein YdhG (YjbR/CyaY superfamily)